MADHYFFLTTFFFFALGIGAFLNFSFLALRTQNKQLLSLLFFFLTFSLVIAVNLFYNYFYLINKHFFLKHYAFFNLLLSLFFHLMIFSLVFLTNNLFTQKIKQVFTLFSNGIFLFLTIFSFVNDSILIKILRNGNELEITSKLVFFQPSLLLIGAMIYNSLLGIMFFKYLTDEEIRRLIKTTSITVIFFLPLIFYQYFPQILPFIKIRLFFHPFLYCALSMIFINFVKRVYKRDYTLTNIELDKIFSKDSPEQINKLVSNFRLSPREREIVKAIILGYSNHKIAESLFISVSTVKKHIYNIFKKTKIASRFELIRMIKNL